MMGAVDGVADIVHEAGNLGQLRLPLAVAQLPQDIAGPLGHQGAVGGGMIRIAQHAQILITAAQKCQHLRMVGNLFISHGNDLLIYIIMYTAL